MKNSGTHQLKYLTEPLLIEYSALIYFQNYNFSRYLQMPGLSLALIDHNQKLINRH